MKKEWLVNQGSFDALLDWLDSDRDRAAEKYEFIRRRLIKIFFCRGCAEAEELADETISRVAARVEEIAEGYHGDPALYFYGVAQKLFLEYSRKPVQMRVAPDSTRNQSVTVALRNIEPEYQCLERCLERLPREDRELVVRYYQQERLEGMDQCKKQAAELGVAVNALRLRAQRIRLALQRCILECLEERVS
jgi:DNA-directed RNA polymerase specialized sigma24 family protein